ncbi:MAG: threonine dehydratase [Pseudomonadota bacterium]
MTTLDDLEAAARLIAPYVPPTPQHCWPLLAQRAGCEVWVKHENHTPIGAFKVRGGLVYLEHLKREHPEATGVIAATRGNHGQSIACAAGHLGLSAAIVVPEGNSREKNAAMAAQGGQLEVHGHDFQAALEHARARAATEGLVMVESFHPKLVEGVASYSLELLRAVPDLDALYVPIGLGSGICGALAARDALGRKTQIIGVVAENAPCYALSFTAGQPVSTNGADTFADGVACRVPVAEAVAAINGGVERIVQVGEGEMKAAMRAYFTDTHNVAEGAGAAPLAALLKEQDAMAGKTVGLVLSGGNIDRERYLEILADD